MEGKRRVSHVGASYLVPPFQRTVGVSGCGGEPIYVRNQLRDDAQVMPPLSMLEHGGRGTHERTCDRSNGRCRFGGEHIHERCSSGADLAFERLDDGNEQTISIVEVVLHCVGVAMARSPHDLAQRDRIDSLFSEESSCRCDEGVSSIWAVAFHEQTVPTDARV